MTTTQLVAGTVAEQALHRHLMSHADEESELLDAYQAAAVESHSAAFRYLVSLIVDEERRHHTIFEELVATLQTEVDQRREAFAIPRLGHWGFERDRILDLTENFLTQERTDAARLQILGAELGNEEVTTMWPLLIRLMQADTSKHISILEFIRAQAARTGDGTSESCAHDLKGPRTLNGPPSGPTHARPDQGQ